jgi:hypothetical protein
MFLWKRAGLAISVAAAGLAQPLVHRDLSFLDGISEKYRLSDAEVARLETKLIVNPGDMHARARLLTHYFQHEGAQPRLKHIVWVVKNRPDSKLAGSPIVRITPGSNALSTRSDYEAVRTLWLNAVDRHAGDAAVLGNAAWFFEAEEPARAADLFKQSWLLDPENMMRRMALAGFYTRILSRCESAAITCPDPAWLTRLKSQLDSIARQDPKAIR